MDQRGIYWRGGKGQATPVQHGAESKILNGSVSTIEGGSGENQKQGKHEPDLQSRNRTCLRGGAGGTKFSSDKQQRGKETARGGGEKKEDNMLVGVR